MKYLVLLMLFSILSEFACASNDVYCNREWEKIINGKLSIDDAIGGWEALNDKCAGSGSYEKNLIKLYINSKRFNEARLVAASAIQRRLPGKNLFQLMYLDSIFFEYIEIGINDKEKWEELESHYSKYLSSNMALAYIRVSDININLGNYKKAKRIAEEGVKLSPEWGLYRNIMLANYNLKNYSEVPYDFQSAFRLNKQLIGNKNLMLALARSYIELNNWVHARNTLINLRKAAPTIELDQDYIDTALLLKKRMIEAGVIEQ